MTEFQTTKIGDRWFLVFEEGMIPVDSVKEMGFTGDVQRLTTKDGSVRIETQDNEYFVTPVKPKLLHDFGEFSNVAGWTSTTCIRCHAQYPGSGACPGKPSQPQPGNWRCVCGDEVFFHKPNCPKCDPRWQREVIEKARPQ
jgi:hypothetical protein